MSGCWRSNRFLQNCGGSRGRWPWWREGYTSLKKYHTRKPNSKQNTFYRTMYLEAQGTGNVLCPTITPQISSLGTVPCSTRLNAINTHGRYGAVNTSNPRNDSRVSGFRRDHMYTSELERAEPRKGIERRGESRRRSAVA